MVQGEGHRASHRFQGSPFWKLPHSRLSSSSGNTLRTSTSARGWWKSCLRVCRAKGKQATFFGGSRLASSNSMGNYTHTLTGTHTHTHWHTHWHTLAHTGTHWHTLAHTSPAQTTNQPTNQPTHTRTHAHALDTHTQFLQ